MTGDNATAVIIAAKDAAATIDRAVASALREPEVVEVVVVDDGSTDSTADTARAADDGSGRLRIERLSENRGPSAARNHALATSSAPYVSILDSDDMVMPGRFSRLFAIADWDLVADNIVFLPETSAVDDIDFATLPPGRDRVRDISLLDLVLASTSRYGRQRTQLGFLKPVIRRSALDAAGLRYDEQLRLGEDFVLYARLLARGARFRLTEAAGYVAIERPTSLSVRHGVRDLANLLVGEEDLLARLDRGDPARAAVIRRVADTRRKWALRAFLDRKRMQGPAAALRGLGHDPAVWYGVAEGIVLDKARAVVARVRPRDVPPGPRLLLPTA